MEKILIESIKDSFDYYSLWKYREEDINIVDCLSHFIENSINLCKNNYWDKNIVYDLEIKIIFNNERKTYLITDNSGGFNEKDLTNIMLSKINHSSKMYTYAQNIKRGIFWLGKNASITIKQNENNEFYGDYLAKNKTEDDLINIKVFKLSSDSLLINNGTAINISECYTYNRSLNENNWSNVKKALGNKFSYYLSNNDFGTCKIIVYSDLFINKDLGRKINSEKLESNEGAIFKTSLLNKKFLNNELNTLIDDNLEDMKDDNSFQDFKFKILNDQKLIFKDEIFINNYLLPIKVYILSKPSIHLAGVAISYENIFVYYSNLLNKTSNGLYIPFNERIKSGSWRWLRLEINLNSLKNYKNYVTINDDRNKLVFNSENFYKDSFDNEITKIIKKWCSYSCFIKNFLNQ